MKKELDLTGMDMVNQHYNLERIVSKSVKKKETKAKRIFGEIYRGKYVTREQIKVALAVIGFAVIALKGLKTVETLDYYNATLNKQVRHEMSAADSKEFLDNYDTGVVEKIDNYTDALDELNKDNYDILGNRKDGSHNETIKTDGGSIINLSDKEKDALELAAQAEIEEYKRGK